MRVLLSLCVLIFLAACSKSASKAKIEITTSFAFGGSNLAAYSQGGLMIWGMSSTGDSFSRVINDSDSLQVDVPNGSWIFSAVAWANPNNKKFEAVTMRCARSSSTSLNGGEASLNLVLSADACENQHFRGGPSVSAAEVPLSLHFCKDTKDITASTQSCSYNQSAAGRKADKAPVMSVSLKMAEYDNFGGKLTQSGTGLSRCVTMPNGLSGEWTTTGDFNVPVGNPADPKSSPFRIELDLHFNDTNCSGADPSRIVLPNGLVSQNLGHKYFGDNVSYQILYVNVPDAVVCEKGKNTTPFAGGDGSSFFPNLICSAEQLYNIHDATTDLNHSFRLMADIDLNKFSKGISAAAPTEWPMAASCWSEGQNWQPIGYDVNCALIPGGFKGSFNGGDHVISGMRMRLNHDKVGFIGEWAPIINSQLITNLVLEKPEIEGTTYVGGIVGMKSGSLYSLIANSEVRGGEVTAGQTTNVSDLGGIIGRGTRAQLLNLKTSRVKIEGEGNNIGGIFGYISGSQSLQKLVTRSYVGAPEWANAQYVGGIGGYFGSDNLNASQFGEWASESIVVGSQYVGGLLGEWDSTYNTTAAAHRALENVYAAGSVTMRGQTANYLGGLFGKNYASAVLDKAYFAGSLLNDSKQVNCGGFCSVGWVSGRALAMTRTNLYVMSENAAGHFSLLPRGASYGDDPDGPSGAPPWTIPEISTSDIFVSGSMSGLTPGLWEHLSGDKPRLAFEKHPCSADPDADNISPRSTLAIQKTKWGAARRPMMICRKSQFAEISTELVSGKIAVIVGALNLASSTAHVRPSVVNGAYLTGEGGYVHGLRRSESVASLSWSIFDSISGALKNLLIAGLDLQAVAPVTVTSSISGLAQSNSGTIENVKLLTGRLVQDDTDVTLNGLVGSNGGTLRDVSFEGTLSGYGEIAGLVSINNGTIEDSEAAGQLHLNNGGANIGGVTLTNSASGTIKRVSVRSKLDSTLTTTEADQLGMVAVINRGTILDVHITSEAYWRANFGANNPANRVGQVAGRQEGASSSMKRVIVEGFLHDVTTNVNFENGNSNFVKSIGGGTYTSIFARPAGRVIKEFSSGYTCSGSDLIFNTPALSTSFLESGPYWQSSMGSAGKIVWVILDYGDGHVRYTRVLDGSYSSPNLTLSISDSCSSLNNPSGIRLTLLQDFDNSLPAAVGNLLGSPFVGFTTSSTPYMNLVGADWEENITGAPVSNTVISRGTEGLDWILDVMGEFILNGTNTIPAPIWEVENENRIELFRIKK